MNYVIQDFIPRYAQHDDAIVALLKLRRCYDEHTVEYRAVDAMCETVNRLGGTRTHKGASQPIPTKRDAYRSIAEGLSAVVEYMKQAVRSMTSNEQH